MNFHAWGNGSWVVLFSHPKDFTPVCTTEIAEVCRLKNEFEKRKVKVIGISTDSKREHKSWIKDIEATQKVKMNFPVLSDIDRKVSEMYGMLQPAETRQLVLIRSVYIIDPNRKIRLISNYPPSTGRHFDEVLRVIDSL